jgi:hypothetical protein
MQRQQWQARSSRSLASIGQRAYVGGYVYIDQYRNVTQKELKAHFEWVLESVRVDLMDTEEVSGLTAETNTSGHGVDEIEIETGTLDESEDEVELPFLRLGRARHRKATQWQHNQGHCHRSSR